MGHMDLEIENQSLIEVVLNRFYSWGITTLFVIPGAQIQDLLIRAAKDDRFRIVIAAHEQGAGYMADGYARASCGPGTVITTNGPGANNLTTAAVTTRMDHSPVLFLTGDTPTFAYGFGAFQCSDPEESNSSAILQEALEYSFDVIDAAALSTAFLLFEKHLFSHSQAPMHINLPCDIARLRVAKQVEEWHKSLVSEDYVLERPAWLNQIPVTAGNRAAILVGEEIKEYSQLEEIAHFSKRYAIPVASTLGAKNIQALLSEELYLGVFGYAGGPKAYEAILDPKLDTLIIFGALLNERNTVAWSTDFFRSTRNIIRFSIYKDSVRYLVPVLDICNAPADGIYWMNNKWDLSVNTHHIEYENRMSWIRELQDVDRVPRVDTSKQRNSSLGMSMIDVVSMMNETLSAETLFFLDSGDHRIYGATYWDVKASRSFFTAAKTAPMGWAIGAAIGASFVNRDKQVCVLTGDGCMLMHGTEIAVAARYQCKVIFMVSNNTSYGRIGERMKSEDVRLRETLSSLPPVSWSDFAQSLGVSSRKVSVIEELPNVIQEAMNTAGPFLIEMIVNQVQTSPFSQAIFSSSSHKFAEDSKTTLKFKQFPEV